MNIAVEILLDKFMSWHGWTNLGLYFLEFSFFSHQPAIYLNSLLGPRELKSKTKKRIKSNWNFPTIRTSNLRTILTCKSINNEWRISFQIVIPTELTNNFIRSTVAFNVLEIRFFSDSVKIFMKFIKEVVQKLLTILMIISSKLRVTRYYSQHTCRFKSSTSCRIESFHKFTKGTSKITFTTQDILNIEVFKVLVFEEIFNQRCKS